MKNKVNSLYKLLLSAYGISMFSEGVLLPIYAVFVQRIGGDILEHTDKDNKLFERGLREGMQDIINGLAAIIGGLIAAFFGFKRLIAFMILMGTISLIMILVYVKKYKSQQFRF